MAGAPKGNNNAAKGKRMSNRLLKRLEERELWDSMADALLEKALEGDISSIKEVFDRIDGKAPQSIDLNADITAREEKLTPEDIRKIAKELDGDC
ncbi:hypothetical protein OAP25_02230 [Flavobacteriaceae bacterium]|nr:hypothetical protein [Flavobacteriaceae bacterium]